MRRSWIVGNRSGHPVQDIRVTFRRKPALTTNVTLRECVDFRCDRSAVERYMMADVGDVS
jgi:hypothetical protein